MTRKLFLRPVCLPSTLPLLVFSHPNGARANYGCVGGSVLKIGGKT
jgi:hypothetical protein